MVRMGVCIVMELCPNGDLHDYMLKVRNPPPSNKSTLALDATSALIPHTKIGSHTEHVVSRMGRKSASGVCNKTFCLSVCLSVCLAGTARQEEDNRLEKGLAVVHRPELGAGLPPRPEHLA